MWYYVFQKHIEWYKFLTIFIERNIERKKKISVKVHMTFLINKCYVLMYMQIFWNIYDMAFNHMHNKNLGFIYF